METEEVKKDIRKFSAIDAVSNTPGGKILVTSIERDVISAIDELCNKHKTASHIELISICAGLSTKLALLRALKKAKKLKKLAKEELDFILGEEKSLRYTHSNRHRVVSHETNSFLVSVDTTRLVF